MTGGDFYSRSLSRMDRIARAFATAGVLGVLLKFGWRAAMGFACGAAISMVNFRLWKRLANAVGESGGAVPSDGKAVLLGLRYILMIGAVFAIIKLLGVTPWTILAGLFVSVAALLTELLCQLAFIRD